jgi:hypothetical protein
MSSASTSGIPFKEDPDIQIKKGLLTRRATLSIATEPKRQKEFDKEDEIYALAESIKAVYYQEYKMMSRNRLQGDDNKQEEDILDDSHLDYIIET